MRIEKHHLLDLERCYATTCMQVEGREKLVVATEGQGACYMVDAEEGSKEVVWEGPGGTMSVVPLPGRNGEFLAVQNFFPTFQSEGATVVWGKPLAQGGWEIKTILHLPYLHRFDILNRNGANYFVGATLCTSKRERDDWSDPGKVYAGKLPDDLEQPMELRPILEGLTKNHGYWHGEWKGLESGFVTAEEGVYAITPPASSKEKWTVEQLLDCPVSDIAVWDVDGDGQPELVTAEPFHGTDFVIRRQIDGGWREIYRNPTPMDFIHVVWAGLLRGRPSVIGGCRRADQELFLLQYGLEGFHTTVIDRGGGPSNIAVHNGRERDIILCANREQGKADIYIVTDE